MLFGKWLRNALLLGALFFSVFVASNAAEAHHRGRVFWVQSSGFSYGWGWFGPWVAVHRPFNPYGRSYWNYWNYQPRYASFGAISYSPETDNFGVAGGFNSGQRAATAADTYCGEEDCAPVVWVQGGCAAVASLEGGDHMGWAVHPTLRGAKRQALRGCRQSQRAYEGCRIRRWVCSN